MLQVEARPNTVEYKVSSMNGERWGGYVYQISVQISILSNQLNQFAMCELTRGKDKDMEMLARWCKYLQHKECG